MGGAEHGHGGEAAHGDFRNKVWTMSGGPNCRPKHWKRNTAIAMAGIFLICIPIAMKSAELELKRFMSCSDGLINLFAQSLHSFGAKILEIKTTEVVKDHLVEKYL
ncbi:hypothetical protein JRO89_XS01G0311000 [Xanthoceras sorbifolium]|uniref:Uncharacterized protein n=1 Tax=Xanthoceras sorbifolium TaxID=99658 RepID=A0ABQ8IMF5_9ROSI|nr:hypothetical protein JRO89_XS01G0311000 [Xanthoceras sorbifolium]